LSPTNEPQHFCCPSHEQRYLRENPGAKKVTLHLPRVSAPQGSSMLSNPFKTEPGVSPEGKYCLHIVDEYGRPTGKYCFSKERAVEIIEKLEEKYRLAPLPPPPPRPSKTVRRAKANPSLPKQRGKQYARLREETMRDILRKSRESGDFAFTPEHYAIFEDRLAMYLDADALPDTPDNRVLMAKKMRGIVRQAPMAPKRAASPRTGDETDAELHQLYDSLCEQYANELVRKRTGRAHATAEEVEIVDDMVALRLAHANLAPTVAARVDALTQLHSELHEEPQVHRGARRMPR
jgi:hypothetical protein